MATIIHVRTAGKLHGQDIKKDARASKDAADQVASKPESKSSDALVVESVRRALQRVANLKPGISAFESFVHDLRVDGQDSLADEALALFADGFEVALATRQAKIAGLK